MDSLDMLGLFWLEGYEDDPLSGRLTFTPQDGATLELVGIFDADPDGLDLHGWVESTQVTLADCLVTRQRLNGPGVVGMTIRPQRLFLGHHVAHDDQNFQTVYCELSHLAEWVRMPGWIENDGTFGALASVQFDQAEDLVHTFSRGQVKMVFRSAHDRRGVHGITLRQRPLISICYNTMQQFETIRRDLGRLQSLLILCLDTYTQIDKVILRRPDVHQLSISGEDMGFEKDIEFRSPLLRHVPVADRRVVEPYEMLLTTWCAIRVSGTLTQSLSQAAGL